jgi:hypothetical protein
VTLGYRSPVALTLVLALVGAALLTVASLLHETHSLPSDETNGWRTTFLALWPERNDQYDW